jgi:PAS domain S-box-containing protein
MSPLRPTNVAVTTSGPRPPTVLGARGARGNHARLEYRTATAAAFLAAALGSAALAGWVADISILKSGVPGLVEMKANAALCLVLVATSLWLLRAPDTAHRRILGLSIAAVAGLIALSSLCEYLFSRDLGIDQLLFHEPAGEVGTSSPGRMAPGTALAFLLLTCGLGLLDVRWRMRGWLSVGLALGAALIAFVALVGYVSGITSLYAASDVPQMAVPTAIAFLLLAVAIACARPEVGPMRLALSDTLGGKVMRLLFPTMLAVPIILGTLRLASEKAGLFSADTGTWLFALSIILLLTPLTWALAASLDRAELASRRAQSARHEAQLQKAAFDEAPIGGALTSLDGRFIRVNRALSAMTGYSVEQLIGMRFADLTHADDRALSNEALAAMAEGRLAVYHAEKRYVHRDGHILHVRVAVTPIYDEAEQSSQFHAQIQDVTEGKLAAQRVEQAQFETLARLAAAAEYRDDDTGQHTRRVGDLSGRLAEVLGLPAELVRLIRLTAPLHDVGKIGIPDAILLKPGRLTEEEFVHMKRHTTIGAQMLSGGGSAELALAEEIAASHHERWDGTGYPAGLAGADIPIAGRIVAVADVFDALTHARPYKQAWTAEDALAELRRQSGQQFDPQVIDAFLALEGTPEPTPLAPAGRAPEAPGSV